MKTKVLIIMGMLFFVLFSNQIRNIYAVEKVIKDNQDQPLLSFEQKVKTFTEFFKSSPKQVLKRTFSGSPTGFLFYIHEYQLIDISYDVRKTDSLVSPFFGYIDINAIIKDNNSCGNVIIGKTLKVGFDNIDETLKNDKDSCFNISKLIRSPIRFTFAYQAGKWVLKNVYFVTIGEEESFQPIISVLGMPSRKFSEITEPEGVSYNKKWKDLIK